MATVQRWTGREARALRLAKRMSVRHFAEHLGVTSASVSNWERRGALTRLRYETQQLLDLDLARSADDVPERFEQWLMADAPASEPTGSDDAGLSRATSNTSSVLDHADLGTESSKRTRALLEAMEQNGIPSLGYVPPVDAAATIADFVASPSRVYVIKGPSGSGKTRLTCHLAEKVDGVDFQLHATDSWSQGSVDLATEVLRYASTDGGNDPLLTLERECGTLDRPTIVTIDGLKTEEEIHGLCRQLDTVLRKYSALA